MPLGNVWKCLCVIAIVAGINTVQGINYNVISNEIGYNEIGITTSNKQYKPSRDENKYKKRRKKLANHWAVDVDVSLILIPKILKYCTRFI